MMVHFFKHPTALVESETIGERTRIWAFVHVMAGAMIGPDCNIGDHCFIESDVVIGQNVTIKNNVSVWNGVSLADGVFVGPSVTFTNDLNPRSRVPGWVLRPTSVAEGASIGANATILCGVTVGEYALVAAGAVVTADVPPYTMVKGNPARRGGFVCRCCQPVRPGGAGLMRCSACRLEYQQSEGDVLVPLFQEGDWVAAR